ncbi:ribonuclease 3 [Desulfuromonas versatilis]|uniref:Ribonuclease 3 n=1 Tax=Desulfuromonas versatilis TaxID=2802975 RepID=A0ABN6DYD2_9BACT|nr:ribonuclease III [Desulfuromonas versatilis]BCR05132.1 ribonuclease 3 [Desulfuromonas versatilis]
MVTDVLKELEEKIDYRFGNPDLLLEALTHKSFSNEQVARVCPHNERLEFLGDAVLDLIISDRLFRDYPDSPEGELTRIRAEVVSEKSLARAGRKLGLGACLRLGKGEARSGGRNKDSLLADALEALLGAVFRDSGLDSACRVTEGLFLDSLQRSARSKVGQDHKTRLQEILQARCGRPPRYLLAQAEGPDHERIYSVEVVAEGRVIGRGSGRTKKAAEQEAAREALASLGG